jgi:hypothetical protein
VNIKFWANTSSKFDHICEYNKTISMQSPSGYKGILKRVQSGKKKFAGTVVCEQAPSPKAGS